MTVYSQGVKTLSTLAGATAFELTSTEEEKKTANRLEISQVMTQGVTLTVWLEREKIVDAIRLAEFPDIAPPIVIPLEVAVPIGETLKAELVNESGSLQGTLWGVLYYSIE